MSKYDGEDTIFSYLNTLKGAEREKWPADAEASMKAHEGQWTPRTLVSKITRSRPVISKDKFKLAAIEFFWFHFKWDAAKTRKVFEDNSFRTETNSVYKTLSANIATQTALVSFMEEIKQAEWHDMLPVIKAFAAADKVLNPHFKKEDFWNQEFKPEDYETVDFNKIATNIVNRVAINSRIRNNIPEFNEYLFASVKAKISARNNNTEKLKFENSFSPTNAAQRDQFLTLLDADGSHLFKDAYDLAQKVWFNPHKGWTSKEALQAAANSSSSDTFKEKLQAHHNLTPWFKVARDIGFYDEQVWRTDPKELVELLFKSSNLTSLKNHTPTIATSGSAVVFNRFVELYAPRSGEYAELLETYKNEPVKAFLLTLAYLKSTQKAALESGTYRTPNLGPSVTFNASLRDLVVSHESVVNDLNMQAAAQFVFNPSADKGVRDLVLQAMMAKSESLLATYTEGLAAINKTPEDSAYANFSSSKAKSGTQARHWVNQMRGLDVEAWGAKFVDKELNAVREMTHSYKFEKVETSSGLVSDVLNWIGHDESRLEQVLSNLLTYVNPEDLKFQTRWTMYYNLMNRVEEWSTADVARAIDEAFYCARNPEAFSDRLDPVLRHMPLLDMSAQTLHFSSLSKQNDLRGCGSSDFERPIYSISVAMVEALKINKAAALQKAREWIKTWASEALAVNASGRLPFTTLDELYDFLSNKFEDDDAVAESSAQIWSGILNDLKKVTKMDNAMLGGGLEGTVVGSAEKSFMKTRADRMLEGAKAAGTNHFLKLTTAGLAGLMARSAGQEGNEALIAMLTAFLESDFGRAIQAIVMSIPAGMIDHPVAQDLQGRLEEKGYELAADALMEIAMEPVREIVKSFAATVGKGNERKRVTLEDVEEAIAENKATAPKLAVVEAVEDETAAAKAQLKAGSST